MLSQEHKRNVMVRRIQRSEDLDPRRLLWLAQVRRLAEDSGGSPLSLSDEGVVYVGALDDCYHHF